MMIHIDNVTSVVGDQKLCAMLTSRDTKVRPLGGSAMEKVRSPQVFLNGNKLAVTGDFTRRVLIADLDPELPEHQNRDVSFDAVAEARDNRPALVVAALTILKAYEVAGRPLSHLPDLGSFEDWSQRIRNALLWLGEPDLANAVAAAQDRDPVRRTQGSLLRAWRAVFGDRRLAASAAIDEVLAGMKDPSPTPEVKVLHEIFQDISGHEGGSLCPRRLGKYLGMIEQVTIDNSHMTQTGLNGLARWYVN